MGILTASSESDWHSEEEEEESVSMNSLDLGVILAFGPLFFRLSCCKTKMTKDKRGESFELNSTANKYVSNFHCTRATQLRTGSLMFVTRKLKDARHIGYSEFFLSCNGLKKRPFVFLSQIIQNCLLTDAGYILKNGKSE